MVIYITIHSSYDISRLQVQNRLPQLRPRMPMKSLAWLTVAGAIAMLLGCDQHRSVSASADTVLKRGLGGEPATLDPAAAVDTFSTQLIQDLYEGLTVESSTGTVAPGIASSWQVDQSGTQYTFYLRADAVWSNGKRVRSQDFVKAWQRVLDPKLGSPLANDLILITGASDIIAGRTPASSLGVATPSDDVLVVNLVQPAPYFPELVAHSSAFPIYSEESAHSHNPADWISDGPYVLEQWQPGTRIQLKANGRYWDSKAVHIQTVQYQFAPDQNAQYAAYRAGQLDMTDTIPSNALAAIRREHPGEVVIAPYLGTAFYGINFSRKPFAGNRKLAKALAMAIDRPRLIEALGLGQIGAFGIVPPETWNYTPQRWDWNGITPAERTTAAKALYTEAGFTPQNPLKLRLLYNANPEIKQTALIVAAMWKEVLGVDVAFTDEEFRVYLQSRHDKEKWDVVRLAWSADYNDASNFLEIFRTNSPNNDTGYSNQAFDKLLDAAAQSTDPELRRHLLETAEKTVLDDYAAIPLYFYVSKRLVKPYVLNVKPNALDRVYSKSISIQPH
jgi:oligopeptide transport system substrate-binding protein